MTTVPTTAAPTATPATPAPPDAPATPVTGTARSPGPPSARLGGVRPEGPLGVPPFAVVSGRQVSQSCTAGAGDRRPRRADLPAARLGRHGQPAVVLPALPRPPVLEDHRAAGRRGRLLARGRPQVDLQLPRERRRRCSQSVGGADPQRPRHRLPVRLPGELDHQRHPDGRVRGPRGRPAQPRWRSPHPHRVLRHRA